MKSMVDLSHEFLLPVLHRGAICVDATIGHGKDTKFFLEHNVLKVYGFEIQEDVLNQTIQTINNIHFHPFLLGHEKMDDVIKQSVDAIIFNFGYCPGKEEGITTKVDTSILAIKKGLSLLKRKGRMALVLYPHQEGKKEAECIENYVRTLNSNEYSVLLVKNLNIEYSPYLIEIEKLL